MSSEYHPGEPDLAEDVAQWQPARSVVSGSPGMVTGGVAAGSALLLAFAMGSVAGGAMAIGALAIGRLSVGKVRLKDVEIDNLVVRRSRGLR